MRKFMDNVAVKYYGAVCFVVGYDYKTGYYTIEDKMGHRIDVKEDNLKYLSDK